MNRSYRAPIENYRLILKNKEDEMMAVIEQPELAHILVCLKEGDTTSNEIDKEAKINSNRFLPELIEMGLAEKREITVGKNKFTIYGLTNKGFDYGERAELYLGGLGYVSFEAVSGNNQLHLNQIGKSYEKKDWKKISILRLPHH